MKLYLWIPSTLHSLFIPDEKTLGIEYANAVLPENKLILAKFFRQSKVPGTNFVLLIIFK